jgi:hypothetical protein
MAETAARQRATTKRTTTKRAAKRRARVRIRMYRQGIGDAFLLSFNHGSKPSHILIDCGVLGGTPDSKLWAQRIAANVAGETGGRVNAIVGTHPHWDHLSGFLDARDEFKALQVDEVWLSWAENPQDPEGRERTRETELQLDGARRALARLAAPDEAAARAAAIEQLLSFYGPVGAAGGRSTAAALAALRELAPEPRYCEPGDLLTPDWLPGVRIYVLAPPRDEKLLGKLLGKKGSEMYGLGADSGFYAALLDPLAASKESSAATAACIEAMCPFETGLQWRDERARTDPALAPVVARYRSPDERWRAIDDQWLLAAEQLALKLDNVVNNLSMVLAFEFTATKEVLLFAADAQIGNWLSWQKLAWTLTDGRAPECARTMLARTVFYKVGTTAATTPRSGRRPGGHVIRARGGDPVDEQFANKTKKWDMPAESLYPRLLEKTRGRVLRADGKGPTATDPKRRHADERLWKAFAARVEVDPGTPSLYVDYFLP